ncbi:hypothetical protein D3C78_1291310 [compost metagenome]
MRVDPSGQVYFIADTQLCAPQCEGVGRATVGQVLRGRGLALARRAEGGIDAWHFFCPGIALQGARLLEPRSGGLQSGVGQCGLLFKLVEARVAKHSPPLAAQLLFSRLRLLPGTSLMLWECRRFFVHPVPGVVRA